MLTLDTLPLRPSPLATLQVVVIGRESVGKSQFIASLTGHSAGETNFRGSTVSVERYRTPEAVFVDTPGILRRSDTATTEMALAALDEHDLVLLVVQATQLDDDLEELWPLVRGKRGAIIVTFWDKVAANSSAHAALEQISGEAGVELLPVDARRIVAADRERVMRALDSARQFADGPLATRAGWRIEPTPGWLERPVLGPVLAILLLVLPALATIFGANQIANLLHPIVARWIEPLMEAVNAHGPTWARVILTAEHGEFGYGLLNMGPFLLVWALPTVLLFAVILGAYKASGLVERINVALHPLVRPLGLSGRDVIRVMMGFGCNVPAVISTRACSRCSRGPAISAIAFGAACSYQLPATLAVLAAAAKAASESPARLTLLFLGYLLLTTLVYVRLTSPPQARSSLNLLLTPRRPFMQWPTLGGLAREVEGTVRQFFLQAMPIFAVICVAAALLARWGVLDQCSQVLRPVMGWFNLPADAALPIVLASIRKDGIFLFAAEDGLAFPMSAAQVLTAVYLAGVLLPCLVTTLTIARETSWLTAGKLLLRQAAFATLFALVLAWGGRWIV
jgi:ferrous iron transport protein B